MYSEHMSFGELVRILVRGPMVSLSGVLQKLANIWGLHANCSTGLDLVICDVFSWGQFSSAR